MYEIPEDLKRLADIHLVTDAVADLERVRPDEDIQDVLIMLYRWLDDRERAGWRRAGLLPNKEKR